MIKFVDTTAEHFDRKRKQPPQRACGPCRKRKKRCEHGFGQNQLSTQETLSYADAALDIPDIPAPALSSSQTLSKDDGTCAMRSTQLATSPEVEITSMNPVPPSNQPKKKTSFDQSCQRSATSTSARGDGSRFIGDMNPESVFLAATSPQDIHGGPLHGDVGVWLAQHCKESEKNPGQLRAAPPASVFHGYTPTIQQIFLPILERDCLTTLPLIDHREALQSIYFRRFHPVLPIVNQCAYEALPDQSASRVLLEQGMCLVSSADTSSKPHLLLGDDNGPLSRRDFGRRILAAMRLSIEIGMVTDKLILVQALGLMSLFTEGREGGEISSLMVARAVQYLHSLGLHMQDREEGSVLDHGQTLFCCIWTIDRLNAASQGRPVVMHERDIGRPLRQCFDTQSPSFRLLLHVVDLLDTVIGLYRPGDAQKESDYGFCLFEDLVLKCDASHVSADQLATIETLYHAVGILSCRLSSNVPGKINQPTSRLRQAFSMERVTLMVGHERHKQLILFPFVSYVVSLSLSVSYREMRRSRIPMFRARARIAFEENSQTMKQLGEVFWSAEVMAEMSILTLKELDRVCFQITDKPCRVQSDTTHVQTNNLSHDLNFSPRQSIPSSQHNHVPSQDSDLFYLAEPHEIDPFEMFDPDFDLDRIDACLEGNLDLAVPMELLG